MSLLGRYGSSFYLKSIFLDLVDFSEFGKSTWFLFRFEQLLVMHDPSNCFTGHLFIEFFQNEIDNHRFKG